MLAGSYEWLLHALAARDDRVVVLTAENRAAVRRLPDALGPRFVDVGIAEQTLIGMGAGLALRGRIPVMHALAAFLTMRAFEFIRTDIGIARLPAKLVGGAAGILSDANGPTHQAIEDVALMRAIPNMTVVCPADLEELLLALPVVLAHDGPCYVRYTDRPAAVRHAMPFELGRAELLLRGTDVALLGYGALVGQAYDAACRLAASGLSVRMANMRTLEPVDEIEILAAAQRARLVVTIEDHFLTGGLYSIVAERLVAHGVSVPVLPIAFERRWFTPALLPDALEAAGLTGAQLAERIRAHMQHLHLL